MPWSAVCSSVAWLASSPKRCRVVALLDHPEPEARVMLLFTPLVTDAADTKPQLRLVPVEAVGTDVGEDKKVTRFVWVNREGVARKVPVETGLSDDRWEAITSGLAKGDRIAADPLAALAHLAGESNDG